MTAAAWRVGMRVRVRGRRWRIETVERGDDCTALRLTELDDGPRRAMTVLAPFDRPLPIDQPARLAVVRPRRWLHEIDRALSMAHPFGGFTRLAGSRIRVLPYQLEPALAMLRHGVARVLVADDVGLGKTIEAGLLIAELTAVSDTARVLVLTPAGLREQWCHELATHFDLSGQLADTDWLRRMSDERPPGINPWTLPGIYVASHDLIKRPEALRGLDEVGWDLVVVDEAHAASPGTERRAAIHRIACRANRVMLLTATPPAGDPRAYAALSTIGRTQDDEPPVTTFARSAHDVRPGPPRRSRILMVAPAAAEMAMHRELERYSRRVWCEAARRGDDRARLASIVLRKRALSSAGSLLVSLQRRIDLLRGATASDASQLILPFGDEDPLDDAEPIDALAAPGLDDAGREIRWLSTIAEMARAAARGESKIRWLLRLLSRVREPVIVFTEYRDTLARLERQIAASGRSVAVLHGGMDPKSRACVPAILRGGAQTLVATDAAAEGLNLQHRCRMVVHFELPWNPARLEQRAGRVDRIGQRARVHEIALVSSTTAERLVLEPLARRAAHVRRTGGRARLLTVLTESRVAEAVMSASPIAPEPVDQNVIDEEMHHMDLRGEAALEAGRAEMMRCLAQRSPERRARAANPALIWVARTRSRTGTPGLLLLCAVEIETPAGRRVHTDHVLVRLARSSSALNRTRAELRRVVIDEAHAESIRRLMEDYSRSTLSRVSDAIGPARRRVEQRSLAIERTWADRRQPLQRQMLMPEPPAGPERVAAGAATIPDVNFTARWRLVSALFRDRGRHP